MSVGFSYAKIEVGGATYQVSDLAGSEALSTLFRYEIAFTAPVPCPSSADVVGASATLILEDRLGNARTVAGVVSECRARVGELGAGRISLVLRPTVFALTLGRSSRTFQDSTLHAILGAVLGGAARLEFPSGGTIPYRVQRAESDWAFVERTLSDAGLVYWFDHEAGSTLVVSASADQGPVLEGAFPVHVGGMIGAAPEAIVAIGATAAATSTSHAMKGFRWENPTLPVGASAGGGAYESYDRVLEVPGLNDIGASRVAAARGRAASGRTVGTARTVRLYPGVGLATDETGAIVVHSVAVSIEDEGLGADGASALSVAFTAAPAGSGAAPPRADHRDDGAYPDATRSVSGLSYAIIAADAGDEVFPDKAGRVRAQHHWDRSGGFDAKAGTWLRPTQRLAPGSMMWPRTGWVVATMGQCGDGDSPIALGRIHDGDHPPSYPLPANKTRVVYKTATVPGGGNFNEIHFEDKKGAEVQYIHAARDTDILTKNFKSDRVFNDAWHTVDGEQTYDHKEELDAKVLLSQTVTIGKDETVKTGASFAKTVGGNESIEIGGSRKIHSKDLHSTSVKKARKLSVGAAMIDISLGKIGRTAKNAVSLVGGLVLRMSGQGIRRDVGPVWVETVGGIKLAKAAYNVADASAKDFVETVGGAISLEAGTNINEDAGGEATWTVGATLSGSADEALIEAHDKLEIVCGSSVLKLDDKSLTLSSTKIELSGGALEILSGIISHN